MKKLLVTSCTLVSFLLSSTAHPDAASPDTSDTSSAEISPAVSSDTSPVTSPDTSSAVEETTTPPADTVKQVNKGSTDAAAAAKRSQWINIGLAVGAVIVATVALILVSNNNGHHHHHHD